MEKARKQNIDTSRTVKFYNSQVLKDEFLPHFNINSQWFPKEKLSFMINRNPGQEPK